MHDSTPPPVSVVADDAPAGDVVGSWRAIEPSGRSIATATATRRADDRVFVRLDGKESDVDRAIDGLLRAAARDVAEQLSLTVRRHETARHDVAGRLGWTVELESVKYSVGFEATLAALGPARRSDRWRILTADTIERNELFDLDVSLRGDTPGNDGWRGARAWFDEEMSSPEFDSAGHHVAVLSDTGRPIGLCRMWRNPDGPSLGMLGVAGAHRNGFVARELLRSTLTATAVWGWNTFAFHTARPGLQRHAERAGATVTGGFTRYVSG